VQNRELFRSIFAKKILPLIQLSPFRFDRMMRQRDSQCPIRCPFSLEKEHEEVAIRAEIPSLCFRHNDEHENSLKGLKLAYFLDFCYNSDII